MASGLPFSMPLRTSTVRYSSPPAIIIAAFIPLFTLSGVEGHIFGPMALTYAYALPAAFLLRSR